MTKRPDLPKRLAAQIRAAQRRVADARESLSNNIRSRKQAELEVEEYDADPEAFAARYYPGKGVDSYPVMTRIERRREALAYYTGRFDHKVEMVLEAESELLELEQDILMQVLAMRLTKGREPWPKPLSVHYISDIEAEVKAERERHARLFDERRRKLQLEAELEDAALRKESDREADAANAEYDAWFRSQPPHIQERVRAQDQAVCDALREGRFTVFDILEYYKAH